MGLRVPAWTMVMPVEPRSQIVRQSDIMPRRIRIAADDVDDAFPDAMHAMAEAGMGPREFSWETENQLKRVRNCFDLDGTNVLRNLHGSAYAASPLRRDSLRQFSLKMQASGARDRRDVTRVDVKRGEPA
jgi:hypothetical protein